MPRPMPDFAGRFEKVSDRATSITSDIEAIQSYVAADRTIKKLSVAQMESVYEIAFMNVFCKWEDFLEQSFLRYMCGYTCTSGFMTPVSGAHYSSLAAAHTALLGGRDYILWHSPSQVKTRSRGFFAGSYHETVLASHESRLEQFSAIRHHIAHAQEHARRNFDVATMTLAGRRIPGGNAGRFLRGWTVDSKGDRVRWLNRISTEFKAVARQITP